MRTKTNDMQCRLCSSPRLFVSFVWHVCDVLFFFQVFLWSRTFTTYKLVFHLFFSACIFLCQRASPFIPFLTVPLRALFLEPTWVRSGAFLRALGIIFGRRLRIIFVHFFQKLGCARGLIKASAVAGSPLCGALDKHMYTYISRFRLTQCLHQPWLACGLPAWNQSPRLT